MSTFDLENPNPNAGDALRDEAANLLSVRCGRVTTEHRVSGKKADIFFTRNDFGKRSRLYVEAKDYTRPLKRSDVVEIWADYSGIIAKNRPANLLVITRSGLSADAQAYIEEQPEMRHQTIWELENETLGLTEYVRSLEVLFDQDGLSRYYIDGRARRARYSSAKDAERAVEPQDILIFDELLSWITSDDYNPVAVLGGYGAGKSSLARRLASSQAREALSNPLARRPVLIPLGSLARFSSLEGLLGGMFTHDFPVEGFNVHHFLTLNQKGRLLIILDGFDEMKHAMTWADFRAQISDLNKLTQGRAKVVLLGRPSAFLSTEEQVHVLRGMKRHGEGWRRLPDWPEFREYDLQEFLPSERADFVRGYLRYRYSHSRSSSPELVSQIDARAEEVNRIADLDPDMFGKPVHAKILTDLASDAEVDLSHFAERLSRWSLYDTFFHSLAEREVEKDARRPIGEVSRLEFLREVAYWLWTEHAGATAFLASDLPDALLDMLHGGDASDNEALTREYLTGSFLEKKSGDLFYFGHRSFAEFLVAWRMAELPPDRIDHSVYSRLVRDGVALFLREAPNQSIFTSWAESLSEAHGTIYLEYFEFLAEKLGTVEKLTSSIEQRSIWRNVTGAFRGRVAFDDEVISRICRQMRTTDSTTFFLLLSLLQISLPWRPRRIGMGQVSSMVINIAAAILDRVFLHADFDRSARRLSVTEEAHAARLLAQRVLPRLTSTAADRTLVYDGTALLDAKKQQLGTAGVGIDTHVPMLAKPFGQTASLPWSDVLARMDENCRTTALAYFQQTDDWRGAFTAHHRTRPRQREASKPRRG